MNDVAAESAPPAVRERGWWRVVLATLLFLVRALATPVIKIVLPVDQALVLLAPALAACAVAGWWAGGRLPMAFMWIALSSLVLVMYTSSAGAFAYLACGWAVLLASTFA